jgi:hypothetical protein
MGSRITLTDNTQSVLFKMSEGNPGALTAMCEILKEGEVIDPQAAMGAFSAILTLDTLNIYGSDIYILWNDQCNRDVREMLMLLRAYQLGFVEGDRVKVIAADQMRKIKFSKEEMDEFDIKVCGRLEQFKRSEKIN